jgi:hypothetical protein
VETCARRPTRPSRPVKARREMSRIPDTQASLILRLHDTTDVESWEEFVAIYRSLVVRLARLKGLQPPMPRNSPRRCSWRWRGLSSAGSLTPNEGCRKDGKARPETRH